LTSQGNHWQPMFIEHDFLILLLEASYLHTKFEVFSI